MVTPTDIALLLLRFTIAAIFTVHATQKAFGWFDGPGRATAAASFERLGQRPGSMMVTVAATAEAIAAVTIATGVVMPLGAALGAATMLVAGASLTRTSSSLWNTKGGGEYPLVLAMVVIALGWTGPGRWSVDGALNAPWHDVTLFVGSATTVAAVLGAASSTVHQRFLGRAPAR